MTDQDFRGVASGEFTAATASDRGQFQEPGEPARSGDRADRLCAAMAYRRLGAFAGAISLLERLAREAW